MRAFVVKKPFEYGLENVPMPVCAYDGVVVKVLAAAICHSDLDIIEGRRKFSVRFPNTTGHEFTGVVVEKGAGVRHVRVGDHVVCECIVWCGVCPSCRRGMTSACEGDLSELGTMEPGGFAEYAAVPGRLVHPATGLTVEEAALMEPAGNGCHAAESAGILTGDRVAVIGPGPIGILAMQFANIYQPSQLIMVGTRDPRLEFARRLGATHTVNINKTDAAQAVMEITGGQGCDRVINCATTDASCALALKIAGRNSVIAMEGVSGSGQTLPVTMDDFNKPISIVGVNGVYSRHYEQSMALVREKRVDVKSLITHRFPLEQMDEALRTMKEKRDEVMKILIFPNGEIRK